MVRKFEYGDFEDFDAKVVQLELVDTPPPPPTFSEEELSAAKTIAFGHGQAAGRNEVETGLLQRVAGLVAAIEVHMVDLTRQESGRQERFARDAAALAVAMLRKLSPALASKNGLTEIEHVIAATFEEQAEEPRIVIRVHDSMLDPLQARIGALAESRQFAGRLVLLAEPTLGPGDIRVEWADGGAERRVAVVLETLERMVAEAAPGAVDLSPTAAGGGSL